MIISFLFIMKNKFPYSIQVTGFPEFLQEVVFGVERLILVVGQARQV